MRVPPSIRSTWEQAASAARRLADALGVRVAVAAAAAAVLVVVVALLAVLLARWPLVLAVLVLVIVAAVVVLVAARVVRPIRALTDDVDRAANETLPAVAAALESGSAADADVAITARGPAEVIALAGAVTSFGTPRSLSPGRSTAGTAGPATSPPISPGAITAWWTGS